MTPSIIVNFKKIQGGFVAQCAKNPQFIVQTKTKNQIEPQIKNMIGGYVKAFPKEKKIVLPNGQNDFKVVLKNK